MKITNCNYEYLNQLFEYIESNISYELDTGLLSNISYVARDKLYKDFYSVCGHTVKEYIRKRRLSNALSLIKTSDLGFADIAFQCGYSSHQALCRAVKQNLGVTLSEYKKGNMYYFFPPYKGKILQTIIVHNDVIPPTLRIVFYSEKLEGIERKAISTFFKALPNYSGRILGRNGKQKGKTFCYELYLSNKDDDYSVLASYGFEITYEVREFSSIFAMSIVNNNEQQINEAWNYLYSEWLYNSMFEYTEEPYYEEYVIKNGIPIKLKLYLPIKVRKEVTKINLIGNPDFHFVAAKANGCDCEKKASELVMNYLRSNYPYIIMTTKTLYLHKETNLCICGVKVDNEHQLVNDNDILSIVTDQNYYLVLESGTMGDYNICLERILNFAFENGMKVEKKEIFANYEVNDSLNMLKLKMYCPVKIHTN